MTVTYRHENSYSYKKKGVKHTIKESITDGDLGMSFYFLKKVGDDDFYRVSARETEKGKYEVKEKKGEKEEEPQNVSEADLKKMLKKNKDLKFVVDFMAKEKGKYGAYKKSSKKSSKKKKSKKSSKKKKSKKSSKKKKSKKSSKKKKSKKAKKSSKKKAKKSSKKKSKKKYKSKKNEHCGTCGVPSGSCIPSSKCGTHKK